MAIGDPINLSDPSNSSGAINALAINAAAINGAPVSAGSADVMYVATAVWGHGASASAGVSLWPAAQSRWGHQASASAAMLARSVLCQAAAVWGHGASASGRAVCGCVAQARSGHAASASAVRRVAGAAGASYGHRAGASASRAVQGRVSALWRSGVSADGRVVGHIWAAAVYGYSAEAMALRLHGDFFDWGEGVGYRVVRADQAPGGLAQGGIKRDALMGTIQRRGL